MVKYKRNYKTIINLKSYKSDTDKYEVGELVTIGELDNISFDEVLKDLNERLINMDFLGTNIILDINELDARTIIDSYNKEELVEMIELPGTMTIEINPAKVADYEVESFLIGVIDILNSSNSKVMALGYTIDKKGQFKLVKEDDKKENTIVIEFVVKKMKEI